MNQSDAADATLTEERLIAALQGFADDSMWAEHAEVPKYLLRSAVKALSRRALPAPSGEIRALIAKLEKCVPLHWNNIMNGREVCKLGVVVSDKTRNQIVAALRPSASPQMLEDKS